MGTAIIGGLWLVLVLAVELFRRGGHDVESLRCHLVAGVLVVCVGVIIHGAAAWVER